MNRILIIEDEESIANMIKLCLSKHGYACMIALNGMQGLELLESQSFVLVLLDIMLPDMDGISILEYISPGMVPVILVTAKGAVQDKVLGLRSGAEDYIVKSFDLEELLARVETVLRRYHKMERYFEIGTLKVDTLSHLVYRDGQAVLLAKKEYDLLLYLIRNPHIALYRETIFEQVWQEPYYANTRTIDLHIQRLKKKLRLAEAIETVYKVGYRFWPEKVQ